MVFHDNSENTIYLPPLYGLETTDFTNFPKVEKWNLYQDFHFVYGHKFNHLTILGSGGPIRLTIPVKKHKKGTPLYDIQIDYLQKWQHQHWRSILSCYSKSPYFQYFKNEIENFFLSSPKLLIDFTTPISKWIILLLYPKSVVTAKMALANFEIFQENLLPIQIFEDIRLKNQGPSYVQVFGQKFVPSLSILDAIFCVGPGFAKM